MNYSTLKEAYSVDTFEREKKPKSKKKHRNETLQETLDEQEEDVNKEFEDTKQMEKPKKVSKKEIIDEKPVKPFYDEELEKYLNVNDFQDTQPYYPQTFSDENDMINFKPIENKPTKPTKLTLNKKIQSDIVQSKNTDYTKDVFYKNLINIGLFILIGIMIIFLCDQITEIAINIGMKKTFQLLEPYLQHRPM